jgi:uncharacterized protein (TIGR02996 family)
MRDEDAFLRAIAAAPADDAPRLVYADWLDEHGRPERAEFIRAQCELARPRIVPARRRELAARAQELLAAHRRRWLGELAGSPVPWIFRRGFVERLGDGGVFRRAPETYRDETYWEHLRFFPGGRVLWEIYEGPKRAYRLSNVAHRLRPRNRNLWRGDYTIQCGPDGAGIEFTVAARRSAGIPPRHYRGTIQGTILRVEVSTPSVRGDRPYREEYRWAKWPMGAEAVS